MKRSEKVVVGLVVVGVVAIAGFCIVAAIANQRRAAALARIPVPESIALYRDLDTAAPESAPQEEPNSDGARHNLRTYQELFKRLEVAQQDTAWKEYGELQRVREEERPNNYAARLEACLKAMQPFLADIRAVAVNGGPVQPLDFSKGASMELPHLHRMREMARVLAADTEAAAREGDVDRAVNNVLATMQLGDALEGEPILISQLVRIANFGIAYGAMERALPTELPAELADRLINHMAKADRREAFADCYAGEAVLHWTEMDHPERLVEPHDNYLDYLFQNDPISVLYNTPLGAPLLSMDSAEYLDTMARLQEIALLPYYQALPRIDVIDREVENLPITRLYSRIVLPGLARPMEAQARHEAMLDLAMLGLSIEQFHQDFGVYPERLEDGGVSLPGGLPVDVYTGNPYIYRPSDTDFLLYSVGSNLVDDHGRHELHEGDIVWRGVSEE